MRSLADWLRWQETLHPSAIDLGLDRMRRTLQRLQWRQPSCPVITVAGTNGKGSTVALTSQILRAAGYRVGTFTSPHLIRYNERIVIDGREASDESLVAAFERIDAARGTDTLTFFEFNTLAALLVFDAAGVDAMVLEVGLGGRLDSVNAVDADVAIVTSIALDHCDWLGSDVDSIGREKAGIFRAGKPAIFGSRDMPASIEAVARDLGTPLYRLGQEFNWRHDGEGWFWRGRHSSYSRLPRPALHGELQFDNASAVLCALECLSSRLPITREAIEAGLQKVTLPGRFQVVRKSEPAAVEWILDVAHNPAAAQALAGQLASRPTSGRTIAVCGILGDKDIEGIATTLRDSFDAWVIVGLPSARSVPVDGLALRLANTGARIAKTAATVAEGCEVAQTLANAGDRIVVFGSFLTVGPALEWLQARS
ncbi:bifunctional folylpolyglutamate synthase/dihydrofolate synthase [Steroidobacter agaridevorans]|uniref:Dihydrofolate synthase/folylpolyglutamate synthase n=1 Tax=Steroidobacter agaridevorans TaxID=2695856 RepID=A0A829Y9W8_9GAMM|nr:bifunctional tetrahydrofolate synthase/dihydrofolate synthase [Steroidobacter agaridevorans]GFE79731.1 bifunctional folylpolyglutamate synthase/dihydrofolate synthase [Steroidobacter agaridevorans]GFE90727.1 bifunctional folylpolyglutamate synthase/dihydrofolate synthase [Steroidobacter agaridevorans]